MEYKFGSYTSLYCNPNEARRCFASLQDKVDVMIAHFGPYDGFDPDGLMRPLVQRTMAVARSYNCEIYDTVVPLAEHKKRGFASEFATQLKIDFLLIIDSDEYIDKMQTRWNEFKKAAIETAAEKYDGMYNIFSCAVEHGNQTYRSLPRVWFNPHQVRYNKTHFALMVNNPKCPYVGDPKYSHRIPSKELIPYLVIRSDYSFRDCQEKGRHTNYHNILGNRESVFSNDQRFM